MLNNIKISSKLMLNSILVLVGLLILGVLTFSSVETLKSKYTKANILSKELNHINLLTEGGLLVNSASAVYAFNPIGVKPVKQAQKGLDLAKKHASSISNLPKASVDHFLNIAQNTVTFAGDNRYIDPETLNTLLKAWRPLKFEIQKTVPTLEKETKKLNKEFESVLNSLVTKILTVIVIIAVIVFGLNILISKGIIGSLSILEESMEKLAKGLSSEKIILKNKDETLIIAEHFNTYMDNVKQGLEKDKIVINEVKKVIEKINVGLFNTKVKSHANSKEVEQLVEQINNMIDTTSANLHKLSQVLIAYGNSDFNYEMPKIKALTGLMASLFSGVGATGNTIQELLALIDNSTKRLLFSSKELNQSSKTLSDSSNAQAASLEQTAAAIEEVTQTIQKSAQNTISMSHLAKDVTQSTNKGKDLANKTADSMDDIANEVGLISESISVIDQISFQTNILSLNAAVEAATAGEAGKGFAVVAGEVRNLASRSAEAANEIKRLVESAQEKTKNGKTISSDMIQGYNNLGENIEKTISLIDEVANSSKEQQAAMSQINDAVTLLDQATQKNAKEASQISQMAQSNEQLASSLEAVINRTTFDQKAKRRVCDIDMIFDTTKLKLNHLNFKDSALKRCGDGEKFKVTNHHECALGKWIDSHEDSPYANTKEWEELKKAHEIVHNKTQDTVDLYSSEYQNKELFSVTEDLENNIDVVFNKINGIKELNCDHLRSNS